MTRLRSGFLSCPDQTGLTPRPGDPMAWVRIDDQLHSHPKIVEAGNVAVGAWIRMLAWTAAHLTDGRLSMSVALMMANGDQSIPERLCTVGLLDDLGGGDLEIHDYLDWNPTADHVRAEREKSLLRVKRHRAKKRGGRNGGVTPLQGRDKRRTCGDVAGAPSPSPSPSPLERDREIDGSDPSDSLDLLHVEKTGFEKYGQLGGTAQASVSQLCPIYRHEIDAALKTEGNSWKYAVKVIRSYRKAMAKDAGPPGSPKRKPRGAFAQVTQELLEGWAQDDERNDQPEAFSPTDVEIASLLPREGD